MNRLAGSTSPYLRQHAENPVDWYPWSEEAFERARREDRPVFLSIGYSACHWCHVMAHESFEDPETAAVLNEHFVSIKVDREERPDVDAIYMEAVQAIAGHGGWPMSVFLEPDGRPFFAGTYFPKTAGAGPTPFLSVLEAVTEAWGKRREDVDKQADLLTEAIGGRLDAAEDGAGEIGATGEHAAPRRPRAREVAQAVEVGVAQLADRYDPVYGGFGRAPKFPQPPLLELLLRAHVSAPARPRAGGVHSGAGEPPGGDRAAPDAFTMVTETLEAMASGGIYDHLGGGFARYSVDRQWLVPHFEKMLYDQAGLARVYLHAWQLAGDPRWRQVLDETVGYVLRDLRDPGGGVRSAEDADSEGEEGLFYLWTKDEVEEVLAGGVSGVPAEEAAGLVTSWYGVTAKGNFEGRNILHRPVRGDLLRPPSIEAARRMMLERRARRVRPGIDDKVLTEWNAMFCSALAEAAAATGDDGWANAAVEIASFLVEELRRPDGRWLRSYKGGDVAHLAYAADYAWLVDAFTRVAELTGEGRFLDTAVRTAKDMLELFADPNGGGLYVTGADAERLIVRPKDLLDGVTPAAGSVAASALARLGALLAESWLGDAAAAIVAAAGSLPWSSPTAFPHLLGAAELLAGSAIEVVVTGDRPDLLDAARSHYLPGAVLAWGGVGGAELFEDRADGFAYVCRGNTCLAPAATPTELVAALDLSLTSTLAAVPAGPQSVAPDAAGAAPADGG
jgi:uncharacterized protein YyaL (SSP411 family)